MFVTILSSFLDEADLIMNRCSYTYYDLLFLYYERLFLYNKHLFLYYDLLFLYPFFEILWNKIL